MRAHKRSFIRSFFSLWSFFDCAIRSCLLLGNHRFAYRRRRSALACLPDGLLSGCGVVWGGVGWQDEAAQKQRDVELRRQWTQAKARAAKKRADRLAKEQARLLELAGEALLLPGFTVPKRRRLHTTASKKVGTSLTTSPNNSTSMIYIRSRCVHTGTCMPAYLHTHTHGCVGGWWVGEWVCDSQQAVPNERERAPRVGLDDACAF